MSKKKNRIEKQSPIHNISDKDAVIYQLFKEEQIINGYLHLVQKKLHGVNNKYVGIKDCHIKYAEKMKVPIMIHYCPDLIDTNVSLRKATYKDQKQVMIIENKDLYNLKHNSMSKIDKDGNPTNEPAKFPKKYKSDNPWFNNITEYEVWHYPWNPNYVANYGVINNTSNIDEYKI